MVNKRVVSINILFSLLQILITGLVYYLLYKYLLKSLGPDLMGVWAIVLSISSTANIANLGIGASVVRYTATYKAKDDAKSISQLVHTSFLFLGAVFLVITAVVYLVAPYWLHAVIEQKYYPAAMALVPLSLSCLFLNAISGVFLSCIDGLQKNYIRSLLYIISFAILIGMVYVYVPSKGLVGVAYAQLGQAVFLLLGSLAALKSVFKGLSFSSVGWNKAIFKNIFRFGMQEQIISICQLCFDPFTKSLLGSHSLPMVTYYEMANRLVLQLRGFLVSANQVFIPVFASTNEKTSDDTNQLYKQIFSVNFLLGILWAAIIIACVVPVNKVWIGAELNQSFLIITLALTLSYLCNILMSPAYFANMGRAKLKNNVIGNVIIGALNVVLCFGLGFLFQGYGIIAGWSLALSAGSLFILFKYNKENSLGLARLLTSKDILVGVLAAIFCVSCCVLFYINSQLSALWMFAISIFLFAILCLATLRIHPVGITLSGFIKRKLAK